MQQTKILIEIDGKTIEIEKVGDKFVKPAILKSLSGYNVALKPAYEPILCFRKPLEGTYAHSALTYGTGALNIDGCRVATGESTVRPNNRASIGYGGSDVPFASGSTQGRWPANVLHDGSDQVTEVFDLAGVSKSTGGQASLGAFRNGKVYGKGKDIRESRDPGYGDTGSAARFFYCAKASSSERNAGLEGMPLRDVGEKEGRNHHINSGMRMENGIATGPKADSSKAANHHPTVKPLALTEYLARLIVPPEAYRDDAQLLIPYAGVGSEAIGAARAGWRHITGIELDAEYCEINRRRFDHWTQDVAHTVQPALLEVA